MVHKIIKEQNECPYLESNCNLSHCPCAKFKAWKDNPAEAMLKKHLGVKRENRLQTIFQLQKEFVQLVGIYQNMMEHKSHWIGTYQISMLDEIGEVLQGIQWKHWKKRDPEFPYNTMELQKELIDLVHFIANLALVLEIDAKFIMDSENIDLFMTDDSRPLLKLSIEEKEVITVDLLVQFAKYVLAIPANVSIKEIKFAKECMREAFLTLFDLCFYWGMRGIDVHEMYIKKNAENLARQKNNY